MSVILVGNTNRTVYVGDGASHPLAASLGDIVLCSDCGGICFKNQTSSVAEAGNVRAQKTVCLACQTKPVTGVQVEYVH